MGLSEKTLVSEKQNLEGKQTALEDLISGSFLEVEMKERYSVTLAERYGKLAM